MFQTPQPNSIPLNVPPAGPVENIVSNGPSFSVAISKRDASSDLNFKTFNNPNNPNELVSIIVGGVRIAITSPEISGQGVFQSDRDPQVNLLADNIVRWEATNPDGSRSEQLYLEGNVVFSKDRRTIYAEKMYYDVGLQQGTILKAEIFTPVPKYRGLVRMKAEVVQQVDNNNLQAHGTAITSSRLGVPRYWLQSGNVELTRSQVTARDPETLEPLYDPMTGSPLIEDEYFVESRENRVYLGGLPVFAWPRFKTSLNDPSIYLERLQIVNGGIFGFQVQTGWDLYQLLGSKQSGRHTLGRRARLFKRAWIGIRHRNGLQAKRAVRFSGRHPGDVSKLVHPRQWTGYARA